MIKTKTRLYFTDYGKKPVKVWKLGPIVLRRKPVRSPEALADKFGNR